MRRKKLSKIFFGNKNIKFLLNIIEFFKIDGNGGRNDSVMSRNFFVIPHARFNFCIGILNKIGKIIHGQIRLDHVPLESSIEVRGFRPAQSAANLQSNEFFCSYRADTLYREANRIVYFWAGRSGQLVYVSYQAVASPITADDMNEIGEHLTNSEKRLDAQDVTTNEIRNSVVAAREEARKTLAAHN